jgi:hypothetical protein
LQIFTGGEYFNLATPAVPVKTVKEEVIAGFELKVKFLQNDIIHEWRGISVLPSVVAPPSGLSLMLNNNLCAKEINARFASSNDKESP